jgi:hypothetical protein
VNSSPTTNPFRRTSRRVTVIGTAALGLASLWGCQCQPCACAHPANPTLRQLEISAGASAADADRAALSRFVGVWTFDGWSAASGCDRKPRAGKAAAAIEDEHFVLIDLQTTSGPVGGHSEQKSGSLMLGSEPGIGVTLTAWGSASPSISRFVGSAARDGSFFCFKEVRTVADTRRLWVCIWFETDDQWTAQVRDGTASDHPLIAEYKFTRTSN